MFFGIVCIDIYGYYPTLGLYSAGKSMHYVTPLLLTLFLSLILPLSHTTLNSVIHSKFETAKVYFIQLGLIIDYFTFLTLTQTQPIWLSNCSPKCSVERHFCKTYIRFWGCLPLHVKNLSKTLLSQICHLYQVEKLGSQANCFLPSKISQSQMPQTIIHWISWNRDGYTPSHFIPISWKEWSELLTVFHRLQWSLLSLRTKMWHTTLMFYSLLNIQLYGKDNQKETKKVQWLSF